MGRSDSRPRRRRQGSGTGDTQLRRAARRRRWDASRAMAHPYPELQATGRWRWAEAVDWLLFIVICVALVAGGAALGWPGWSLWLLVLVGAPLLATLNEVLAVAWWGATPGKRLAGLRVVRADTLGVPGLRRAAIRTVLVGPLVWFPLHSQVLARRRALLVQDRVAGTVIVDDAAWRASLASPTGAQDGDRA